MAEHGINTVRTYVAPEGDLLDALARHNIRVIVGFPRYDDRNTPGADISNGGYKAYVTRYKGHPAILAWELGNEYNKLFRDHPEWCSLSTWWSELKQGVREVKAIDPNHPVITTLADMHLTEDVPQVLAAGVDMIGLNAYRGEDYSSAVRDMRRLAPNKPMYFSEGGVGTVDEDAQARGVVKIWGSISGQSGCVGMTYMSWQDEWWKAGNPSSQDRTRGPVGAEEFWGFVTVEHRAKKALDAIAAAWGTTVVPVPAVPAPSAPSSALAPTGSTPSTASRAPPMGDNFSGVIVKGRKFVDAQGAVREAYVNPQVINGVSTNGIVAIDNKETTSILPEEARRALGYSGREPLKRLYYVDEEGNIIEQLGSRGYIVDNGVRTIRIPSHGLVATFRFIQDLSPDYKVRREFGCIGREEVVKIKFGRQLSGFPRGC